MPDIKPFDRPFENTAEWWKARLEWAGNGHLATPEFLAREVEEWARHQAEAADRDAWLRQSADHLQKIRLRIMPVEGSA